MHKIAPLFWWLWTVKVLQAGGGIISPSWSALTSSALQWLTGPDLLTNYHQNSLLDSTVQSVLPRSSPHQKIHFSFKYFHIVIIFWNFLKILLNYSKNILKTMWKYLGIKVSWERREGGGGGGECWRETEERREDRWTNTKTNTWQYFLSTTTTTPASHISVTYQLQ